MHEFVQRGIAACQRHWQTFKPYGGVLSIGLIGVLIIMLLAGIGYTLSQAEPDAPPTAEETAVAPDFVKELLHLQTQIQAIQSELKTFYEAIEPLFRIPNQLEAMDKGLDKTAEQKALRQAEAALQDKLDRIFNHQVTLLEKITAQPPAQPQPELTAADLPFNVISIDRWNGQAYALVTYQSAERLLAKGEQLADWTVQSLDFEARTAVFRHAQSATTLTLKR